MRTAMGTRKKARWRRTRFVLRKRSGRVGLALILFVLVLAVYGLTFDPYGPRAEPCFATCAGLPPLASLGHPFGTFPTGEDVFSEVAHGAPIDLLVGFGATAVAVIIGTVVGVLAGYLRGLMRDLLLSFIQVVLLLPSFLLVVFFFTTHGDTNLFLDPLQTAYLALLLGAFSWPPIALVVRNAVMTLKEEDFITGVKALGAGNRHILFKHILPNLGAAIPSVAGIVLAVNITLESLLVYLGLIPTLEHQALVVSWGFLLWEGTNLLLGYWWVSFFPGLMIVITVLGFNLIGDAIQEALSPRVGTQY
jgi:peptide/nickel transport system permease protein